MDKFENYSADGAQNRIQKYLETFKRLKAAGTPVGRTESQRFAAAMGIHGRELMSGITFGGNAGAGS